MRIFYFVLFSFTVLPACAQQRFSLYAGTGIGAVIEEKFDASGKGDRARICGRFLFMGRLTRRYSIGVEFLAAGRLGIFTGSGLGEGYDPVNNTRILNNDNMSSGSYLLRNRYLFKNTGSIQPYADLGLGGCTVYLTSVTQEKGTIRKSSVVLAPEVGVIMSRFMIGISGILGAATPSFSGYDSFSNSNVVVSGKKTQQVFISVCYRIVSIR